MGIKAKEENYASGGSTQARIEFYRHALPHLIPEVLGH
jgi:hypothetical protein